MMRALTLLVVGCIAGAAATYALRERNEYSSGAAPSWLDRLVAPLSRRGEDLVTMQGFTSRLAAFRAAAAFGSATELEATLERLAGEAPGELAELDIDAALARLAELDPARAADVAVRLEVTECFVVLAFQSWARRDFDAALRGAVTLDPRRLRTAVLLGMLDATSEPESGVSLASAALPAAEGESFFVEWVARLAAIDPAHAFREALAFVDADTRERAILRVAGVWARQNPIGALEQSEVLRGALGKDFRSIVGGEWARRDPDGMLDYLSSSPRGLELDRTLQWLPAADPARTLEVARGMSGDYAGVLVRLAQRERMNREPDAVLAEVRMMPPGRERDELMFELASIYGRGNPQDMSAWLESMSVISESYRRAASLNVAITNPSQLRDVLESLPAGQDVDTILRSFVVGSRTAATLSNAAAFADVLLAWDDTRAVPAVGGFLSTWLRNDAEAAIDWAIANRAKLDRRMFGMLAQNFASQDARAAVAQVERLPSELRDEWIASVIQPYVRSEARAALEWLTQFRGQPVYERSLRDIAARAADRDPRTIARLVAEASAGLQLEAAPAVVSALSALDEGEAARWAQSLSDARARQQAILTLVPRLARGNPAEARQLVESYVSDPAERQRALAIVDRAAGR